MPPTEHAVLGASSSHRWMACPGSVRLSEGLPDHESEYAREGSAAHALAETILRGETVALGAPVPGHPDFEITDEMLEAVEVFVEYVREQARGNELFIEQTFDLDPLKPPAPMFGTADAVVWDEENSHLHVIDYKHGQGVAVDADENSQLMYYALGAVVELRRRPAKVTVTIVQPRGFHPAGPVRSWSFTWDDLKDFKDELFTAAERTQDEDAPLEVGDHCRFCKALPTCPAQAANAVEVAQTEFDVIEETEGAALPAPADLDTEQLLVVLRAGDYVMDWIRAVHEHAIHLLDTGHEVPGWKLVEGRSHRRWSDEEAAAKYLQGKGLKKNERYKMKLISPAQAERTLKSKGMLDGSWKLEKLIEKPEGKPKLAPADDARPALPPSAQEDFDIPVES